MSLRCTRSQSQQSSGAPEITVTHSRHHPTRHATRRWYPQQRWQIRTIQQTHTIMRTQKHCNLPSRTLRQGQELGKRWAHHPGRQSTRHTQKPAHTQATACLSATPLALMGPAPGTRTPSVTRADQLSCWTGGDDVEGVARPPLRCRHADGGHPMSGRPINREVKSTTALCRRSARARTRSKPLTDSPTRAPTNPTDGLSPNPEDLRDGAVLPSGDGILMTKNDTHRSSCWRYLEALCIIANRLSRVTRAAGGARLPPQTLER